MERIIISLDKTKLINELLEAGLVDDIGEKTNGAWKKENINSQDIDLAVAARHHHPDFLITGDKLKIKEISSKHKYTMTIQNIETKECYVL